ncbi:hypothetical protein D3C81_2113610 [compost metagenome]
MAHFCGVKLAAFCIYSGMMESGQKHPPSIQVGVRMSAFSIPAFRGLRIRPATVPAMPIDTSINAASTRKYRYIGNS